MKNLKIVYMGGEGEITEKKSRFIATVRPVSSEEEAQEFIAEMKKKYWNASHNCFAFVLGENQEIQRCSDDGEPGGTAGKPMLDVLLGEEIHNAVVVVTRYFGGTLLGTGGLVRAYSKAVQEGLRESIVITKQHGWILEIRTDYNGIGKIQYLLGQRKIAILDSEYTDVVMVKAIVPAEELTDLKGKITEGTNGKAEFLSETEAYFAFIDGKPEIFS